MTFTMGLFATHPFVASSLSVLLSLSLLAGAYLAYKRLKTKKARLAVVLVSTLIATLSIFGLAFDLQLKSSMATEVYLLTNNATKPHVEGINTEHAVFALPGALTSAADYPKPNTATRIHAPEQILSYYPTFEQLHIVGDGLDARQWQDLQRLMGDTFKPIAITFTPTKSRVGLVDMHWPREVRVGQYVQVSGRLQVSAEQAQSDTVYQVDVLDPAGQVVQTARVKSQQRFSLSFAAKAAGRWIYRIQLSKVNDPALIADEPMAFAVLEPEQLKIVIVQSAPSFETRQLKNWAGQFANSISVLTQISQNKYVRHSINMSKGAANAESPLFTPQSLAKADWLVLDGRALVNLSDEQKITLGSAVNEGLGVYVTADKDLIGAWPLVGLDWLGDLDIEPLQQASYSAVPLWANSQIDQLMPLAKARLVSSRTPLVQSHDGQTLVSEHQIGRGKIAISLISTTYAWQTAGLTEQYSHYWQSVILALARPKISPYWLSPAQNTLNLVNQRQRKCILGTQGKGDIKHNQQSVQATRDLVQDELYCLPIWPQGQGWQELTWTPASAQSSNQPMQDATSTWFYSYTQHDWSAWQQAQKFLVNQQMALQQSSPPIVKTIPQSIDKTWFWAMLVLSMSILWLERKLF